MADSVAGVCLAAGAGTRLRPLTDLLPKPLCPVGDRPLVDWALDALDGAVRGVAVNVCHHPDLLVDHLGLAHPGVHVSLEPPPALGTAGAIGRLRPWLDGRPALVVNADTWHRVDLRAFVHDWDGERVRLLTPTPGPFGAGSGVVASLLPPWAVDRCEPEPSGLWEHVWSPAITGGRAETVHVAPGDGPVVDCGTPSDYLRANLLVSGGASVVGDGAVVEGTLERCVVWAGARVGPGEHLVEVVRAAGLTVPAPQGDHPPVPPGGPTSTARPPTSP
jgi:NDP-sugar pyrophosphorylase family protein